MPNCRSCSAPIIWAKTANNKLMPLDAEPAADGNCVLAADGVVTVLAGNLFDEVPPGSRHRSHFATCPRAAMHRKVK